MTKPGFFEDTFEKLVELGSSTGKKATQQVAQTFSPLKLTEKIFGQDQSQNENEEKKADKIRKKENSHTPLNFQELQRRYAQQDTQKEIALKNRLFQLVRQGEENVLQEKKQEKERKKTMEEKEKEEKERQARLKAQQQAQQEEPKGKIRHSIFSPKTMAQKKHAETKPAVGKQ